MKIFTLLLAICVMACESEVSDQPQPQSIVGSWLWLSSNGGHAGNTVSPAQGEEQILKFTQDGQFSLFRNDTLMEMAAYTISSTDPDTTLTLSNRNHLVRADYISLMDDNAMTRSGDSVWFYNQGIADGYVSLYVRIFIVN